MHSKEKDLFSLLLAALMIPFWKRCGNSIIKLPCQQRCKGLFCVLYIGRNYTLYDKNQIQTMGRTRKDNTESHIIIVRPLKLNYYIQFYDQEFNYKLCNVLKSMHAQQGIFQGWMTVSWCVYILIYMYKVGSCFKGVLRAWSGHEGWYEWVKPLSLSDCAESSDRLPECSHEINSCQRKQTTERATHEPAARLAKVYQNPQTKNVIKIQLRI